MRILARKKRLFTTKMLLPIFVAVLFLLSQNALAQTDTTEKKQSFFNKIIRPTNEKNIYWAEFLGEAGPIFNVAGHDADPVVDNSHYRATSIKFAWQKPPSQIYSQIYRLPKLGFGFFTGNFSNGDIGYPLALFGWFEIPILYPTPNQKFSFGFSGGFGFAWDFNIYNKQSNQNNLFISTTRNCYVDFALFADYHFTDYFSMGASIGFKHFSNGARQKPNFGINIMPFGLSAKVIAANYQEQYKWKRMAIPEYQQHWRVNTMFAAGQKQNVIGGPTYWKYMLGTSVLYQPTYKHRVGLGVDLFISTGRIDSVNYRSGADMFSPAAVVRWEWVLLPRLTIPIDFGVYLTPKKAQNDERQQFYERIGVRGYITKNLWLGLTIKAHASVADFFEWGLGYTFHHDKNVVRIPSAME